MSRRFSQYSKYLLAFVGGLLLVNVFLLVDVKFGSLLGMSLKPQIMSNIEYLSKLPQNYQFANAQAILEVGKRIATVGEQAELIDQRLLIVISVLTLLSLIGILVYVGFSGSGYIRRLPLEANFRPANSNCLPWQKHVHDIAFREALSDISRSMEQIRRLSLEQYSTNTKQQANLSPIVQPGSQVGSVALGCEIEVMSDIWEQVSQKVATIAQDCQANSTIALAKRMEWSAATSHMRIVRQQHGRVDEMVRKTKDGFKKGQTAKTDVFEMETALKGSLSHVNQRLREANSKAASSEPILTQMMSSIDQCKSDVDQSKRLVEVLSQRAEEIVNMIDIIDDIAEQTNLLALNASIEAARAGEQGQGFAVVAEEVLKLAARSNNATRTINDLLGTIQEEAATASSCLVKSSKTVSDTNGLIRQFEKHCRSEQQDLSMSQSETEDLSARIEKLFHILSFSKQHDADLGKMIDNLARLAKESERLNTDASDQISKLAASSDQLSRNLSRQYSDVSYCVKLLGSGEDLISQIEDQNKKNLTEAATTGGKIEGLEVARYQAEQNGSKNELAELEKYFFLMASSLENLRQLNRLPIAREEETTLAGELEPRKVG